MTERIWCVLARGPRDPWGLVLYPEHSREDALREAREYRERNPHKRTKVVAYVPEKSRKR